MVDSSLCYSQVLPCGHPAITDKIQIPGYRGLPGNDSCYYGLSLIRTLNKVPSTSAITRVDCIAYFIFNSLIVEKRLKNTLKITLVENVLF